MLPSSRFVAFSKEFKSLKLVHTSWAASLLFSQTKSHKYIQLKEVTETEYILVLQTTYKHSYYHLPFSPTSPLMPSWWNVILIAGQGKPKNRCIKASYTKTYPQNVSCGRFSAFWDNLTVLIHLSRSFVMICSGFLKNNFKISDSSSFSQTIRTCIILVVIKIHIFDL